MKLRKNCALRSESLYFLEDSLGDSSGHGVGCGGEDIDWTIRNTKEYSDTIAICCNGSSLDIHFHRFYDDLDRDEMTLSWDKLPIRWRKKLFSALRPHVVGRFPKEFY
jgi:hypothetical protein